MSKFVLLKALNTNKPVDIHELVINPNNPNAIIQLNNTGFSILQTKDGQRMIIETTTTSKRTNNDNTSNTPNKRLRRHIEVSSDSESDSDVRDYVNNNNEESSDDSSNDSSETESYVEDLNNNTLAKVRFV